MPHKYCKPILFGLLTSVSVIICVNARPGPVANDNAQSVEISNNKFDSVQILQLDVAEDLQVNGEVERSFPKRLFYNVSHNGLHIPVQVIYDAPAPSSASASASSVLVPAVQKVSGGVNTDNTANDAPIKRNSKQLGFADQQANSKGVVAVFETDRQGRSPPSTSSANAATKTWLAGENERTNTTASEIQEKYIVPILDKLKELTNQNRVAEPLHYFPRMSANSYAAANWLPSPSLSAYRDTTAILPFPVVPYGGGIDGVGSGVPPYYYLSPNFQRQWASPIAQYFPIVIRDPFQSVLNYFSDLVEYGPAADVCLHKRSLESDDKADVSVFRAARSSGHRAKRNARKTETRDKYQKHAAKDDKRVKRKDFISGIASDGKKRSESKQIPVTDPAAGANLRGTDVGPQISKLIVRRGGVAIAGAGGIATAGSGGTAIVGPGGTAFTTPASSGGVAMVGPGGKVVKVPDLTNVLYGRTGANIAATGAGHATFTTKNGQVFTTSDTTGGVALVNPGGGLLGVSDDQNFQLEDAQQDATSKQTNEMQLPVGARLLTTGPIIYYNPVYPAPAEAAQLRRQ